MTTAQAINHSGLGPTSAEQAPFTPLPKAIFRDLMRSGCVSLFGPHRAGKTTLTLELTRLWGEKGGAVRYLDLRATCALARPTAIGACTLPRGIMGASRHALLVELGQDPTAPVLDQRFQQVLSHLIRRQPPRTLLVLDHWDELPGDIAQELLVALRAALQEQSSGGRSSTGQVHLLLVSAKGIAEAQPGVTSPFLNIAVVHWLPDLSAETASDLLIQGLSQQGLEIESSAVDWLTRFLGGDRDLIARSRERLIADCRATGATRIDLDKIKRLAESMLAAALEDLPDWPLTSELLAGLVSHRGLLDVMSELLAGRQTNLREIRSDMVGIEASGFVQRIGGGYRFRTPFHETCARRLLTPETWGDLAVLYHDWPWAREQYRDQVGADLAARGPFALNDLGMALATCLLRMGSTREMIEGLAEMLGLCFRLRDVEILTVRGRDPRQFQPLGAMPPGPADLFRQIEKCVQSRQNQVSRVPNGQRWVLPLVIQGADQMPYTHWTVLFTSEADWPGPALNEAKRLCLFAQQILAERIDSKRDRYFAAITQSIDEAEGLDAIFERVAKAALDLTAATFSSIEYPDRDGLLSTAAVKSNPPTLEKRKCRQPIRAGVPGRGVTGYVYATGKPLIVGHRDLEQKAFPGFQMFEGLVGAQAEAAVPIRFKNQPYGVINVESEVPYFFAARHVAVVERLAELAGIAISTATRLDRAEHDIILARVFGGIAHEAKNHGTMIAMRARLMERRLAMGQHDEGKFREDIKIIGEEAQKIGLMVDDFRWLAHPHQGQATLMVALRETIAEALNGLPDRFAPALGDRFRQSVAELTGFEKNLGSPLMVSGRPRLLQRVIENLLQNAWEAVVEHKEPQANDVVIRLFADGSQDVIIEVWDRGSGIVNAEELFQPYYTTKGAKGLGLGLVIAKQVIEAHQGSIQALQRDDGAGACFRIKLPQALPTPCFSFAISEDTSS